MDSKVNYTVVGLFVIILSLFFVVIFLWLSTEQHKHLNPYLVYMQESVAGLLEKSPVKFNGVNVGHVEQIRLNPRNLQEVRIVIKVQQDIPITTTTVATVSSQGLTGTPFLALKALTPRAPLLQRTPGEPYPVIPTVPSMLSEIKATLREVKESIKEVKEGVKTVSERFQKTFDEENLANLKKSLNNISKASEQFPGVMSQLKISATSVDQTARNLSQQTLPNTYDAVTELRETLSNLKELTGELKRNPSMLIRGKQPSPAGPGE